MSSDFEERMKRMRETGDEADRLEQDRDAHRRNEAERKQKEYAENKAAWDGHARTILTVVRRVAATELPKPFTAIKVSPYNTGRPDSLGAISIDLETPKQNWSCNIDALTNRRVTTLSTENVLKSVVFSIDDISEYFVEKLILDFMEAVQQRALR